MLHDHVKRPYMESGTIVRTRASDTGGVSVSSKYVPPKIGVFSRMTSVTESLHP